MALNVSGSYNGPMISDYVNHNFAQGDNNTFTSGVVNSFAQGRNNSVGNSHSFLQGYNNALPAVGGYCNVIAGFNNTVTGTFAYQSAIFGREHNANNPYDLLVFGYNQNLTNAYGTIAGGYSNTISTTSNYSILVGTGISAATLNRSVNVGVTHTLTGTNQNNIAVGQALALTNNENCFTVGYLNSFTDGTDNSINVGYSNVVDGNNSIAIGANNNAGDYQTVAIGHDTTTYSLNNFAFGSECRAGSGDYPNNVAFGGYYTFADGYNSQAFGYYAQITPGSAYGTVLGGFATTIEATNCFAHGKTAGADIVGQRAFSAQTLSGGSSSGTFPFGPANAQLSFFAHEAFIAGATGSVDIDIPTDDGRAYSFMINMVMNDVGATPANRGSFVVSQMLAYNDGGTATVVGSPSFTEITDGTDIANFTTTITTSGANVRFTFTRNAATLGYRIAYWISFMEKD